MERKAGAAVRELPTAAVPYRKSGGIDFDKLASTCERLGIEEDESGWPEEFDAPALSRRALGLD